jgi:hypothetical protein
MTFSGDFMTDTFKQEVMVATHDFTITTGSAFNIALYTNAGVARDNTTTDYIITDEVVGTAYVAGGLLLGNVTPVVGSSPTTTSYADFSPDAVWGTASFTARGALIYNTTDGTSVVCVLDFGSDKTATAGDFTVQFPVANETTAIIRITA